MLSSSPSTTPSISLQSKPRTITSLTSPLYRSNLQKSTFLPPLCQRRWASDEAATQSEPEADGASEAQHGDNSIAASAETDASEPTEQKVEAASAVDSALGTASEMGSAAAKSMSDAKEKIGSAAESLSASAGFGSGAPTAGESSQFGEAEPSKTVYVGNLFFDVRAEDLQQEFERAGKVTSSKIIMDHRGLSKGFVPSSPRFMQPQSKLCPVRNINANS